MKLKLSVFSAVRLQPSMDKNGKDNNYKYERETKKEYIKMIVNCSF